ncbi:MAG TPA: hypothetical protein VLO11_11630 [Luteolibacter sp.]|nr:hypothetical protein [Luteolibacter sp.]
MPRRASSKPNPAILLGAAAAIVAAVFAGKSLIGRKPASFTDVAPLNMEDLLDNGHMLRGNEYSVEGSVDEKLQWTADRGQVVSLRVDTPSGDEFVAIEVPQELSSTNIEIRQKYAFRVKFREGGIAVATGINRL